MDSTMIEVTNIYSVNVAHIASVKFVKKQRDGERDVIMIRFKTGDYDLVDATDKQYRCLVSRMDGVFIRSNV